MHRQDPPLGDSQRPAHQRSAHHWPAVCSRGEEPRGVAQHDAAPLQGLHRHRRGHQVQTDTEGPALQAHQGQGELTVELPAELYSKVQTRIECVLGTSSAGPPGPRRTDRRIACRIVQQCRQELNAY